MKKNQSGVLRYLDAEFSLSFKDCLTLMIIVSDNACTGNVVKILGVQYINAYARSIGLKKTRVIRGFPPIGKEHLKKR